MIELSFLRDIDRFLASLKVCAGVDHSLVEPESVKLIPDIIVIGDVLLILFRRVSCPQCGNPVCCRRSTSCHEAFGTGNHGQDIAINIDAAIDEGFTE